MNRDLGNFLTNHGIEMRTSGSAEKGLSRNDLYELLDLVLDRGLKPLGLEVWHKKTDGLWENDALSDWAIGDSQPIYSALDEIRETVDKFDGQPSTVFVLQF